MDEEQQAAGNGIEIMRAHLLAREAERHPYRSRLHHLATTHRVNTSSSSSSGTIENENSKPDNEGIKIHISLFISLLVTGMTVLSAGLFCGASASAGNTSITLTPFHKR